MSHCAASPSAPAKLAPRPTSLPALQLSDLQGNAVHLAELVRDRVTVVDLWASWCPSCKAEHEALDRLHQAYAADGLVIVAVNQGEDLERVRRYTLAHPYSYPVLCDPTLQLGDALGESELPVILVLDKTGQILHRTNQLDWKTLDTVRRELGTNSVAASD